MTAHKPFSARIDMGQPLSGERERLRLSLTGPDRVLEAQDAPSLRALLDAVEQAARAGACCVGGLRYEAATALNPYLPTQAALSGEPLAWFAVWDAPAADIAQLPEAQTPAVQVQWRSTLARPQFDMQMARIHADIRDGAYYQIN